MSNYTSDRRLWVSIRESIDGNLIVKFGGGSREQFFEVVAQLKIAIPVPERKFEDADKSWRIRASAFRLLLVWARDYFPRDRIRLQINDLERLKRESRDVSEGAFGGNVSERDRDSSFGGAPVPPPDVANPGAVGDIGKLHRELREARRQVQELDSATKNIQALYDEARSEVQRLARQSADSTRLAMENARLSRELASLQSRSNGAYHDSDLAQLHIVPGPHVNAALVKAVYRAMATIYHPDKSGGSNEKMKAVNAAYDRLKRRYQIA